MTKLKCILLAATALCVGASPAGAVQKLVSLFASPSGQGTECSERAPCSAQGAAEACPLGGWCLITLTPGLYLDPAINFYYHRTASFTGDCSRPEAVVLRATKPGALIWVQDHATAIIRCMTLDAVVDDVAGIAGRQHVIIDWDLITFGRLSLGLSITEFSIASCNQQITITGPMTVFVGVSWMSKVNLGCPIYIPSTQPISYFIDVVAYSALNAQLSSFSGAGATGVRCILWNSFVLPAAQPFPGDRDGNGC